MGESKVCGFGSQEQKSVRGNLLCWADSSLEEGDIGGAPVALESQGTLWEGISQSVFWGRL